MKNFYKQALISLALLLPLSSYGEIKPLEFVQKDRQKMQTENIGTAAIAQKADARTNEVEIPAFPFEYECSRGVDYNFIFNLRTESMVKIKASRHVADCYIGDYYNGNGNGNYINISPNEIEIRLPAGRYYIYMPSSGNNTVISFSLGDKVYTSVGEPDVHPITLPFNSDVIDFDMMADTIKLDYNNIDVFRRAVIYRFETSRWNVVESTGGESTYCGIDWNINSSARWANDNRYTGIICGGTSYLAVTSTGSTAQFSINIKDLPTAAETYTEVTPIDIPGSVDIKCGSDKIYFPLDLDKEEPLYYAAYSFTLTRESLIYITTTGEDPWIVKPDEQYWNFIDGECSGEEYQFEYTGNSMYGTLPAGTYYVVLVGDLNDRLGTMKISYEKPKNILDSYTDVDYSTELAIGRYYGEFHSEDPILDNYVKGFSVDLQAGYTYSFSTTISSENSGSNSTWKLLNNEFTGNEESDILKTHSSYSSQDKFIVTPEKSGRYRLLFEADTYYGDVAYSIEMKQNKTQEHFRTLTLPATVDTLLLSDLAMYENDKFSYTWKINVEESDDLYIFCKTQSGNIQIRVTDADGNEQYDYGYAYNVQPGEYTIEVFWYNGNNPEIENSRMTMHVALGSQMNLFSSMEEYLSSIPTETLPLTKTGTFDFVKTPFINGAYCNAIKFEVGKGVFQLNCLSENIDYQSLFIKIEDTYYYYNELYGNEYNRYVTIDMPGEYYLISESHGFCNNGVTHSTSVTLTELQNIQNISEILAAHKEYNAVVPGKISGTLTAESTLAKFSDNGEIYAVDIYKTTLKDNAYLSVFGEYGQSRVHIYDEHYNEVGSFGAFFYEQGDCYIVVATRCHGNLNNDYSLDISIESRDMVTSQDIIESIDAATALPANVTMKNNGQSPFYVHSSNLLLYNGAVKVSVTADDLGDAGSGFLNVMYMGDIDEYVNCEIISPSVGYHEANTHESGISCRYRITQPGDYYIIASSYSFRESEYTLHIDFIPESTAKPEDAITWDELIAQTPFTDAKILDIYSKQINTSVLVKGDGTIHNESEYFFADAYKFKIPAGENEILFITTSEEYSLMLNGRYDQFKGSLILLGSPDEETEVCIVIDRYDSEAYTPYDLSVYQLSTIYFNDLLHQTTQILTPTATINGQIGYNDMYYTTNNEYEYEYIYGYATAYKMELTENDEISCRITSNVGVEYSIYYYNEEYGTFEPYNSNHIYRTGSYYCVVRYDYGFIHPEETIDFTLTVERYTAEQKQRVMNVSADPQAITVEDADNDIAIRMSLAEQVTLTAMMETGNRTILAHTAFDWVVSSDKSSAEYVLPAEYETVSGEEIRVTVMINQEKVKIKATAGANGNINPAGDIEVFKGTDQIFEITADNGYVIDAVTVNGTTVKSGLEGRTMGTYKLENMQEGMTLNVTFILNSEKPIESYTVDINVNDESMGSVTITGGDKLSDGTYLNGSQIAIRAIASNGYRFVRWSDGKIEPYREMTVIENINLTAIFEDANQPVTFSVTIVSDDEKMGRVRISGDEPVSGDNIYVQGAEIQARAIANEGYVFDSWSDGTTTPDISITVSKNIRLTAFFTKTSAVENHTDDKYVIYGKDGVLYVTGETGKSEIVVRTIMGCEIYRGTNRAISIGIPGIYLVTIDDVTQKAVIR